MLQRKSDARTKARNRPASDFAGRAWEAVTCSLRGFAPRIPRWWSLFLCCHAWKRGDNKDTIVPFALFEIDNMRLITLTIVAIVLGSLSLQADEPALFQRRNLVAWCIVPFDAKNRSPAERAAMVKSLGFTRVAYDWRANHVASFEDEILQ